MPPAISGRWQARAASGLGSGAASIAGPAARPRMPSQAARRRPLAIGRRCRREGAGGTAIFPAPLLWFIDKLYQGFTLERLAQEAQGSGLYCPRPRQLLGKRGHEDDGGPPTLRQ